MAASLKSISIQGFKSIRNMEPLEMRSLNVLIGANGAGKSNLVDFFRMLRAMSEEALAAFIRAGGGADGFFFEGPKVTPRIQAHLIFGKNEYRFALGTSVAGEVLNVFGVPTLAATFAGIVGACGGCEAINNSPETAPAARIHKAFPAYKKGAGLNAHAPLILGRIARHHWPELAIACPRFAHWLSQLA